ncbi:filamin-A [Caerostris darwini]|uniref:Filamin-A n=1 Tax=Caerostris darwini TaxID=1538125 RepID=A0AAV4T7J1_9ARAC|nr:filamin-A [Caerostris darwini]
MESEDFSDVGFTNVGLKARSPEGHAARAMHIKGDEYIWVEIQEKTFKNWVNEQIRPLGMSISNLATDFSDGLKLIALIEVLQKRKLKKIRKPLNQHQCLENVQTALQAMASDNIKLVNIGNTDIVEGNLKLILGLIWSLILRYQIGRTNFPPKKLMLSWLQAALPDLHIANFTSDWNSGIALSALLDFCKPGLIPHWRSLSIKNSVENCRSAMHLAQDEFSVPMILTPEDLASHNLDELSGMTYLSYFMKDDSPGYRATLTWVQKQLPQFNIRNFTTDWNDGLALCALVKAYGANVPDYTELKKERSFWEQNIQHGIIGGESLGVRPLLKPKELSDPEVEHLGVMAYIARFQWVKPIKRPQDKISITGNNLNNVHVNKPAKFKLNFLDNNIEEKKIRAEVRYENKKSDCQLSFTKIGGSGSFVPTNVGMHELVAFYENEMVTGCPIHIKVHPDISKILYSGIDPCALGSVVEVLINSNGVEGGNVFVEAQSPSGKLKKCVVAETEGVYTATFTPDEIGEWKIIVTYAGEHIHGSPFTCYVYDPAKVKIQGLSPTVKGKEKTFVIDASMSGWGELKAELLHNMTSIPISVDEQGNGIYKMTFLPVASGKYHLNVTFNSINVKGSPFSFRVVETEEELKGSTHESRFEENKVKKERAPPLKEVQRNHISLEGLGSASTVKSTEVSYVKGISEHATKHSTNNLFSSRDNIHQSASNSAENSSTVTSKTTNNAMTSSSQENLSFHQRAELVSSKLMAHKENVKSSKAPAPPTPKKPIAVDNSQNLKSVEKTDMYKQFNKTNQFSEQQSSQITSMHKVMSDSTDSLGAKPKMHVKKIKDSRDNDVLNSNVSDYGYVSLSGKHKKDIDVSQVIAEGEGLKLVPVKQPTTFSLQAPWLKQDDIQVTVTAPSGREIPFRLEFVSHGKYQVEYITPEVGEHSIEISIAGKRLLGSPYQCFAYDSSQIKVGKIPNGTVGKPVEFEINGAEAGSGNLEILVNGGHVTSNVKSLGNHCFLASFIPHTATTHTIEMKFNGHHVPGSPWKCEVSEPGKKLSVRGEALKSFSTRQPASFEVLAPGHSKENIKINVCGPTKNPIQPKIIEQSSGVFRVEYTAFEVGTYSVDVIVDGHPLPGSPFITKAYSSAQIHVLDVPQTCVVGHNCQFQVDASQAGEGQLEISVNDGKVPNQVQVLGNGRCLVSFRPEAGGPHTIDIKFNGENVPGCPIVVEATDSSYLVEVSSQDLVPVNRIAHFNINIQGGREADLKVTVTSPSGGKIPVKLFADAKSGFIGEFLPKEVGPHLLFIEYGGRKDISSPYTIKVYDALQVKISRINDGILGKTYQFTVDASHAGEGNLEITVSGQGRNIPTQVHPLGSAKFAVSFVPTELVDHFISISFNKEAVPGSPFKVRLAESPSKISVSGSNLIAAQVNELANFTIHGLSADSQNYSIDVEGPEGNRVPYKIKDLSDNSLKVEFSPLKTGEYRIHILMNGNPINDSPFATKVYDVKQIKVKEIPKGTIGKPVTFIVETSNAGPGNLEVSVNKGQVATVPKAQSSTQYAISFTPLEAKRHIIDLKFNGETVPGSPFECHVIDSSKVKIKGDGIERVPINRPAQFIIDTGGVDAGELYATVIGPNQLPLKCFIHGNYQSGYRVEYTPVDVGDHAVDVRIDGQPVGSSPYLVKVYDASRVKVTDIGAGVVGKPVYFSIDASQAGAGNLEIIVSVGGRNVPNYVQSEGNARFRVNFKPTEAQTHTLSVKFNGEPVPGSPCYVKVTDSSQSVVTGSSLRMTSLSQGAHFTVDTRSFENGVCKVVVTGPTTKHVPVTVKKTSSTTFDVGFKPQEVGPHQVLVTLDDSPLPGSPFLCNVYDVSKVKVSKLVPGVVGKPCTFQVDASQAGEGTLELVVTTRKSSVRAEVSMKSRGLYDVTFVPQDKISHYVNITFNEEDVPGSPFKIEVHPPITGKGLVANGEGLKQGLVGSPNIFDIETNGLEGNVEVRVTGPNGSTIPASIHNLKHDTYRVEYQPVEIGTYKVEVLHQGSMISSKPFLVEVCDPSRVKILDIEDGIIGREQTFKVDASRAGRGTLNLSIVAANKDVKYNVQEVNAGVYLVTYVPHTDHPHKIDVYYNGHQAPGCPQIVEIGNPSHSIIAHGSGLKSSQCGKTASFFIETGGFGEAKDFDIIVISPSGSPLPVKCYQQKDGSLLAEWPAQQAGNHKIEVLYAGKTNSWVSFLLSIGENISFTLNRKDAGYAELDVTVTSPLGRHLPIEVKGISDGEGELIEFTPTVPGKYKIAITYGSIEVPGSPVTFIAQDSGVPKVDGPGLSVAQVDSSASFKILAKGLWGHPQVTVDGPETEAEVTIEEEEEGVYLVSYTPLEIGLFDVKILWNNKEIPGSPYHPRIVNTNKMRVIGGLENLVDEQNHIQLIVGQEKRIPFDVSDAGPGKPKAEIRTPSGKVLPSRFDQTGSHRYHLHFTPKERGEHHIFVYFADLPLSVSPFMAYAEELGPVPDHTRVVLRGHGLTGAKVGEEAEFTIDGSEAGPGSPEVTLGGVKADIPVQILPIGNNVYKVVYVPTVPGAYLLNVMWSERQVKGCPLKVTISASCDSQKVACSGDGLRGGTVGKEIKAFIDTRKAGPGELTAHCMGPHKVAYCELCDHRDGTFTLYLKPQEGGRHVLTVKYGGENVPGSPFTIRIAGAPDASKVKVYGPGIEPGVLATYQSRFICDTRGAGAGQLTVRIRGPKGAFRVEMQRESQKDRTILCKYDPTEPGNYRLEIKWSGDHVPGSPFMVMIFDTQEELNHYLQGMYQAQSGGHPPLPPADYFGGSMTYSTGFGQMSWRGSTAEL